MRDLRLLATLLLFPLLGICGARVAANSWKVASGSAALDSSVLHEGHPAVLLQPGADGKESRIELNQVKLLPGKRYLLSGWVRTANVQVNDRGRSPIAIGAALSMASMPFDVHSASLAGTRDWTELKLPFTAVAPKDSIVLSVAEGGAWSGQAWFADVEVNGPVNELPWPSKSALETYGPAYRYPEGGWIYLHIEGEPYERGYQHGHLMAHEIETYLERCASQLDSTSTKEAWEWGRTTSNALFLRGFDQEILQEMRGIADGAADAGAKWDGRKLDLIDIVAANTITELGELRNAMPMTPTGLENLHLEKPTYAQEKTPVTARCSAFCATGKATRDGRMMIAHITMWPLTLAEQTNIMLDVLPKTGHRVLMQSYPGGIQSGTDWYQNDVGVVLTETTIRQSPFNITGLPVAFRARKAIQYGDNIDKVVEYLGTKNNGLYTNEWLIGDAQNNEIAMYELGTYKTRLYRSSRNDWFGGTEGFYWGDNNAKDLNVRLEYEPDPRGAPMHVPYVAYERDLAWQNLYEKYHGQIDEQFAYLAFRTAPLVTASAMDAKVASAEMARNMMVWATFGKPNQREWVPSEWDKKEYAGNQGLYDGGYKLFSAKSSPEMDALVRAKEKERIAAKPDAPKEEKKKVSFEDQLWKGWILPASADDTWLSAGSAAYYQALNHDDYENRIERFRAGFRAASLAGDNEIHRYEQTTYKGALLLEALRKDMGDDAFFAFMKDFFAANTTKSVSVAEFRKAAGSKEDALFAKWLSADGVPGDQGGPIYVGADMHWMSTRIPRALLVYGTLEEAGANRYAAERIQKHLLDWYEQSVPIRKDFEVNDAELRDHEVIFVGRPETNSALAAWQARIGLKYDGAVFRVEGKDYASENDALVWVAANPLNNQHMVLVVAGNSPVETVRLAEQAPEPTQFVVYTAGKEVVSGFESAAH
ncbi:MAG: C45 family autoproteolytic acyltransferase/hydrolase [Bryobacteraceae bacterium]